MSVKSRREYLMRITVNGRRISKVVIDPHYELKHSRSIHDETILNLVRLLDGGRFDSESLVGNFQYFVSDGLPLNGKTYKLVWLLEKGEIYIGVVNAYRRR